MVVYTSQVTARRTALAMEGETPTRSNSIKFFPSFMMLMVVAYLGVSSL